MFNWKPLFLFPQAVIWNYKAGSKFFQPRQQDAGQIKNSLPGIHPRPRKGQVNLLNRTDAKTAWFPPLRNAGKSVREISCFLGRIPSSPPAGNPILRTVSQWFLHPSLLCRFSMRSMCLDQSTSLGEFYKWYSLFLSVVQIVLCKWWAFAKIASFSIVPIISSDMHKIKCIKSAKISTELCAYCELNKHLTLCII